MTIQILQSPFNETLFFDEYKKRKQKIGIIPRQDKIHSRIIN